MFLIDENSTFTTAHKPCVIPKADDLLFIYDGNKIGLTQENKIPTYNHIARENDSLIYCFGHINQQSCLLWDFEPIKSLNFADARASHNLLPTEFYHAVAIGHHVNYWRSRHRFCGKCATLMIDKVEERARMCTKCDCVIYPKISPCVIVLVTRGEEMLLARSPHFPPLWMSTIAGFVEIGESVEQTVIREVKEEVGIVVGNIKYIVSQPWPFPDSLMLGFTAEYVSGEITIDNKEIERAGWFTKNNLPNLPGELSIARYLIDRHVRTI